MKRKLFLLVTLGILTLASVGGIGIYAFTDIKHEVSSITEQMIPRIEAAHRLGTIYRDLRLLLWSHIDETDDFLKKAFSEKIHKTELEGQEVIEKYEFFAKNQIQQKELIDAYKEYIKIHHEALAYSEKNQKDLAQVALYGKALPVTTKMETLLISSAKQDTLDEREAALRVEQVYRQAIIFFVIGTTGACILFSLLAWWLLREHSASTEFALKAQTDALTGIGNRSYFNDKAHQALNNVVSDNIVLAVFYMDLNGFKPINDTYGHDVGDEVLKEVAIRLQEKLRTTDILARLVGDEFVFALVPVMDDRITMVAERVIAVFDTPMHIKGHTLHVYASLGICVFPKDGKTIEDLMKKADIAMYKAKRIAKQKNQGAFVFWENDLGVSD